MADAPERLEPTEKQVVAEIHETLVRNDTSVGMLWSLQVAPLSVVAITPGPGWLWVAPADA
jgi:hypothetical protein